MFQFVNLDADQVSKGADNRGALDVQMLTERQKRPKISARGRSSGFAHRKGERRMKACSRVIGLAGVPIDTTSDPGAAPRT